MRLASGLSRRRAILSVCSLVIVVPALLASLVSSGRPTSAEELSATIRYTEYGVPHVIARDYAGLGFGTGYAAAKDNLCQIAQGVLTLRGERSRYFGPDAAPDGSLTSAEKNLTSDLYFKGVNDSGVIERLRKQPYPKGPRREVRELSRGWAAGYNKYLREGKIEDPSCKGARWLSPITELDVLRRIYALTLLRGSGNLAKGIVDTGPSKETGPPQGAEGQSKAARTLADSANSGTGSNAFALGSRVTADRRGLLLGNPHFPWRSGLRFWQMQQTIPGKFNVSGATVLGSPVVAIGYNSSLAWSHTTATGLPMAITELKLAPGDPTSYLVDGRRKAMKRRNVTVQALQQDGGLKPVTGTQWWTDYGPVVTSAEDLELPWNTTTAFALSDPNIDNLRFANTSFELGTARTTDDAVRALKRTQGMPWVDTVAADSRGKALFAQIQVLPNVTDDFAAQCNTSLGKQLFPEHGLAVLDGSRSSCTPKPATLPPDRYPTMERLDHVGNLNDSHWLTNPARRLEGFDRIIGAERAELSLRSRSGLRAVERQAAKGKVSRADIQNLTLSNHSYAGDLAVDATVKMCDGLSLGEACDVLRRWDRSLDTGSRGALLFDRFWQGLGPDGDIWKTRFDPADPLNTPRDLDTDSPLVRRALTGAVKELKEAGIPLNAPLRDYQYVVRDGERIPIGGGTARQGILNVIEARWTPGKGYTDIQHGSTYLQAVSFDGDQCPDARTMLAYSQSADPTSPHHADQTRLFSSKTWTPARFCEADIAASAALEIVRLRGVMS